MVGVWSSLYHSIRVDRLIADLSLVSNLDKNGIIKSKVLTPFIIEAYIHTKNGKRTKPNIGGVDSLNLIMKTMRITLHKLPIKKLITRARSHVFANGEYNNIVQKVITITTSEHLSAKFCIVFNAAWHNYRLLGKLSPSIQSDNAGRHYGHLKEMRTHR